MRLRVRAAQRQPHAARVAAIRSSAASPADRTGAGASAAKISSRPSAVVTTPASALAPLSQPGLGPDVAEPGRRVVREAHRQRAAEARRSAARRIARAAAGDRRTPLAGAGSSALPGRARRCARARWRRRCWPTPGRPSWRATCVSAAAVPAKVGGQPAAERDLPAQTFGDVGVAVVEHPLDERRHRRALHRGDEGRGAGGAVGATPTVADPVWCAGRGQRLLERLRRREHRVGIAGSGARPGASRLVHLSERTRATSPSREVVRRPSGREIRAGVQVVRRR